VCAGSPSAAASAATRAQCSPITRTTSWISSATASCQRRSGRTRSQSIAPSTAARKGARAASWASASAARSSGVGDAAEVELEQGQAAQLEELGGGLGQPGGQRGAPGLGQPVGAPAAADRLRQDRLARLRALLRVAQARSSWHRARLAGIDPGRFQEADLPHLPPMTKDDLMGHWDEIVTDPRLTLERAERHLAGLTSDAWPGPSRRA
jgi:hypothetical protein